MKVELDPHMKSPKRQFLDYFFALFLDIWPLAGPNIEKREGPLQKLARGDRQTHFGTFGFWEKAVNFVNAGFWRLRAPETSIWAPEGAFGPI